MPGNYTNVSIGDKIDFNPMTYFPLISVVSKNAPKNTIINGKEYIIVYNFIGEVVEVREKAIIVGVYTSTDSQIKEYLKQEYQIIP